MLDEEAWLTIHFQFITKLFRGACAGHWSSSTRNSLKLSLWTDCPQGQSNAGLKQERVSFLCLVWSKLSKISLYAVALTLPLTLKGKEHSQKNSPRLFSLLYQTLLLTPSYIPIGSIILVSAKPRFSPQISRYWSRIPHLREHISIAPESSGEHVKVSLQKASP